MTLIIFAHPSHNSHNGRILKHVKKALDKKHKKYEVLDLYKENFQGYFTETEYQRLANRDRTVEPDVKKMQEKIMAADTLIFIYPIWWYNVPAMMKGFMDRCFGAGFAYRFYRTPWYMLFPAWILSFIPGLRYFAQPFAAIPLLKGKKAIIFRTYGGPKLGKRIFGNTPCILENNLLRFTGITKIKIHELFNTNKSSYTQEYEDQYMKKVEAICLKS